MALPVRPNLIESMLIGNFIHTLSVVVIPRAIIERVGLFNEELLVTHDRDLYLRLFEIGIPVKVDEALVTKHWQRDGLVRQKEGAVWREDGLKLLEIFFNRPQNSEYLPMREMATQLFLRRVDTMIRLQALRDCE
jgi:hypothetical protein